MNESVKWAQCHKTRCREPETNTSMRATRPFSTTVPVWTEQDYEYRTNHGTRPIHFYTTYSCRTSPVDFKLNAKDTSVQVDGTRSTLDW